MIGEEVVQATRLPPGHAPAALSAGHAPAAPQAATGRSGSGHHATRILPVHALTSPEVGHAAGPGSYTVGGSSGSSSLPKSPAHPSAESVDLNQARRAGAPALLPYSRGSREAALHVAADPTLRAQALQALEARRYAPSALRGRRARAQLWHEVVAQAALGDPLAPTGDMVFAVVAILRAAGYRAASQVAEQAVLTAKLNNACVPSSVGIALRDARRASQRGMGPPKQSCPIPMERLTELEVHKAPEHEQGPLWPLRAITLGCWWLLREIELAAVAQREVSFTAHDEVTLLLSVSKTDPRAVGATRSHRCACGSAPGAPNVLPQNLCPYCSLKRHLDLLASCGLAAPDAPLFPTAAGLPPSKRGIVVTITSLMQKLNLPSHSASGAPRWGGHSMRVGGVQYLGRSGVEVSRIQALARHSSNAIHLYLRGAHSQALSHVAAEAGMSRSLAAMQQQLHTLQAQVKAVTPLPASSDSEQTQTVWNPGSNSKLHYVRPDNSGRTLCGWQWQHCHTAIRDPPPYVASTCAACRRSYISTPPDPTTSASSSESSSSGE